MDYNLLLGHSFCVQDRTYRAISICQVDDEQVMVWGLTEQDGFEVECRFPAALVIEHLIVEAEIEVKAPSVLVYPQDFAI